jgi:hypothetical protein
MPIEKAFAINATPSVIYDALERDIASAGAHEGETFEILERVPPRTMRLRVTIAGIPCRLTYRVQPRDGQTEVSATVEPFGMRYALFRIMTLGMRDQNFAVPVVEGLANLKASVEGGAASFPDEEGRLVSPPDE